jgi:hypothetical protein
MELDEDLLDHLRYEGVSVDFIFRETKPGFGDLFLICGREHPHFPATSKLNFGALADLQFDQVDDYFGIPNRTDEGTDVVLWLFPLVQGEVVHHHQGPFDGLRLSYSILRNPVRRIALFLDVVHRVASELGVDVIYHEREMDLGLPPDIHVLDGDINEVIRSWRSEGIEPGSSQALELDY